MLRSGARAIRCATRAVGRWSVAVAVLAGLFLLPSESTADYSESFESAEASWRFVRADGPVRVDLPRRTFDESHGGSGCEHLRLSAGSGTYAWFAFSTGRAPIIHEVVSTLWLKSDRQGLQLMARVVLPRSRDPRTGETIRTYLRGPLYRETGSWQRLTISDLPELLDRQIPVLRSQFGPDVDPREAYLDQLVVNAYGGTGVTNVWIDDLEIVGHVGAKPDGRLNAVVQAAFTRPAENPGRPQVELAGSTLLVNGRPFMPRAIEHNGEALGQLKQLGFNTVKFSSTPTSEQLREAARLDLRLIAPPPHITPYQTIGAEFDPVLAWSLGVQLAEPDLTATRQLADEVRRGDPRSRPLVCNAHAALWNYSDIVDILNIGSQPLATSIELDDFQWQLTGRALSARRGTPYWATIQTEVPAGLIGQLNGMAGRRVTPPQVEPRQVRILVVRAIAAGMRGLVFASRTRLDQTDPVTRQRAANLQLINRQLQLIEPWVAAAQLVEPVETSHEDVQVTSLRVERATLLLVDRLGADQQLVLPPYEERNVSFVVPGASGSLVCYRVNTNGLQPLRQSRTAGGIQVTIDRLGSAAMLVVTEDALAIHHLTRQLQASRQELPTLRHGLVTAQLQETAAVHQELARFSRSLPEAERWFAAAQGNLDQASQLLRSGATHRAEAFLDRAENEIARIRHRHWKQAAGAFPTPVASPFCLSFSTLPLHWSMVERMQATRWSPNVLSGGSMDNLNQLVGAGWQQRRRDIAGVGVQVELATVGARSGASLRLIADPISERPPASIAAPPVWVISPPVAVQHRQMVRIHGWVNVPRELTGSRDGLLIFDSLGGPELAHRVRRTSGWEEFTIYRAATSSAPLTLTFALSGIGEAWLDDVTIELLQ